MAECENDLRLEKRLAAARENVYSALSTEAAWNGWFTQGAKLDFREGGKYSNVDRDEGEFTRIVPPVEGTAAIIEFTWDNSAHCPGTRVCISLNARGEATVLELVHSGLTTPESRTEMSEGWRWALDSLAHWLSTGTGTDFDEWRK